MGNDEASPFLVLRPESEPQPSAWIPLWQDPPEHAREEALGLLRCRSLTQIISGSTRAHRDWRAEKYVPAVPDLFRREDSADQGSRCELAEPSVHVAKSVIQFDGASGMGIYTPNVRVVCAHRSPDPPLLWSPGTDPPWERVLSFASRITAPLQPVAVAACARVVFRAAISTPGCTGYAVAGVPLAVDLQGESSENGGQTAAAARAARLQFPSR